MKNENSLVNEKCTQWQTKEKNLCTKASTPPPSTLDPPLPPPPFTLRQRKLKEKCTLRHTKSRNRSKRQMYSAPGSPPPPPLYPHPDISCMPGKIFHNSNFLLNPLFFSQTAIIFLGWPPPPPPPPSVYSHSVRPAQHKSEHANKVKSKWEDWRLIGPIDVRTKHRCTCDW